MATKVINTRELETFVPRSQPPYVDSTPPHYYPYMGSCSYETNLKQYLLNTSRSTPRYGTVVYDRYIPTSHFGYIRATPLKVLDAEAAKEELEPVKLDSEPVSPDFDPFKARELEHPVSNCATLTHLLKSSLGTGILSMPAAFKASGLWLGVFITVMVSVICTYCAYVLVQCAHKLYRKSGKTSMTYAEVAEEACLRGPSWSRKYGYVARQIVLWGIFATYFTASSCYTVIVAENFNYVIVQYTGPFSTRITIAALFLPLLCIAYVPNLKYLAPVSMVANICMGVGLVITCYYLLMDIPPVTERPSMASITTLPVCISIVIFAIEAIGVVMPLENNMKSPQNFIGLFGILNQGMTYVTIVYIIVGFLGYLRFGENTADAITLNLPKDDIAAQAVNILIGLAVFFTYGLVFYIVLDIFWSEIKHRYSTNEKLANYTLRTALVIVSVVIAIVVPKIIPFVSLIGALCFSTLGLLCPVAIEILTCWEDGFGRFHWKVLKHFVIIFTAMLAVIFGSKSAIEDIVKTFF